MNTKRLYSVLIVFVTIIIGALLGSQMVIDDHALAASSDITGSWVINIIPDPATGVPPFVNLSSITKDGVMINSNQVGLTSIGVWEKVSDHTYQATFQGFEESGGQIVHYRVRTTIELGNDKEHFSGPFITDIFDLDGNLLFSIYGTVSADRMHVDPLE